MRRKRYRAKRVDTNQVQVVEALRRTGWHVRHTHEVHKGFPDIVAAKRAFTVLVEIKYRKGRLTKLQKGFFADYPGCVVVARTAKEAVEKCEALLAATEKERYAAVMRRRDKFRRMLIAAKRKGGVGIFSDVE